MPNVMAALPNVGGALCSTPRSLADAHHKSAVQYTLPRREIRWNLQGCLKPQTRQQISAASRPKFTILWGCVGETLLFKKNFPIVDKCLNCEDIAQESCVLAPRWRFLAIFWVLHFQRAARSTFQTCITRATPCVEVMKYGRLLRLGEEKDR